jgi:hypothetical protein
MDKEVGIGAIDRVRGTLRRVKHGSTAGLSCLYTTRPTYSTPEASADKRDPIPAKGGRRAPGKEEKPPTVLRGCFGGRAVRNWPRYLETAKQ